MNDRLVSISTDDVRYEMEYLFQSYDTMSYLFRSGIRLSHISACSVIYERSDGPRARVRANMIAGMLGVHFAITPEHERVLLAADDEGDGEAVGELLEEIERSWDDDVLKADTDKAWDAVHRCLTDGTLDPDGGEYPLSHAVLGGRHLHDEYYIVHISVAEAREVAQALHRVDRTWLRRRFDLIDDPDYDGAGDDADFEYTWDGFVDVRAFYDRAAAAGRAVLFTAT